jgi:hypothetical protein
MTLTAIRELKIMAAMDPPLSLMPSRIVILFAVLFCAVQALAAPAGFDTAVKARIDGNHVVVLFADGTRSIVPLASLTPRDRSRLTDLSVRSPLAKGKSQFSVVSDAALAKPKNTIESAKIEGTLETVQLCPPNVFRNQIGGTCMLYARVHWLDIAGYYTDPPAIFKIINDTPPDAPWQSRHYVEGLYSVISARTPKPVLHPLPPEIEALEWARGELRKGRPILAALPHEIWQALPPGFIAAHPWDGGPVGHQIVINGFTWDKATREGTFHIINSWDELPQFDLSTENAKGGVLVMEQSVSPIGEPQPEAVKEVVQSITLVRAAGKANLYQVKTNLGTRRILAPDETAVREMLADGQ